MKQKVYVIQYESGGIPYEPSIFLKEYEAEEHFEREVVELGFRPMKKGETFKEYLDFYSEMFYEDDMNKFDGCEKYDFENDTVRVFEAEYDFADLISWHMVNLAYFVYNFNQDFIEECWKDEQWLAKHLREKFMGIIHRHNHGYASAQCFMDFVMELSDGNKRKLFEYVINEYKGHWKNY